MTKFQEAERLKKQALEWLAKEERERLEVQASSVPIPIEFEAALAERIEARPFVEAFVTAHETLVDVDKSLADLLQTGRGIVEELTAK